MPNLETHRLRIREFRLDDLDAVTKLHDECCGPAARGARESWLQWTVLSYGALADLRQAPYGDHAVELRGAGDVVGAVGLVPCLGPFGKLPSLRGRRPGPPAPGDLFSPEVGLFWAIGAAHRGHGYASEAAGALAGYAFDVLRVGRLVATTEHSNAGRSASSGGSA